MKLLLLSMASCVALSAAPTFGQATDSFDYQGLVNIVDKAESAWHDQQPTGPYWDTIFSTIPVWADAATDQKQRLQREIQDLMERAKNAHLIQTDFARTKAMIIDCKCNNEIRNLWVMARKRSATRAQFEYVADLLRQRGDAAKEMPNLRQALQDGINDLLRKYQSGKDLGDQELSFYQDEVVRSLLDRAMAWLEDMAVARQATREQFEYVRDLMKDRARIFSKDLAMQELLRRVNAEIDRLMNQDYRTAGFGRDDFAKLRDMVMKKARDFVTIGAQG